MKKPKRSKRANVIYIPKEEIAALAYEIFLSRGGEHGKSLEDWLAAERILIERALLAVPTGRHDQDQARLLSSG